ncbi:MAG: type methionyl aminopeptidase, partial [Bacteroidota bacterium]
MANKEKTIYFKTDEEIALMRTSGDLVSRTLGFVGETLREGLTGLELDRKAEAFIRDHGGRPVFKGYNGFPGTLCISRNEVVVHGVPDNKPFKAGDIISIDCGTYLNDFVGDCAYTFVLGHTTPAIEHLLITTREALYKGIEQAIVGMRVG